MMVLDRLWVKAMLGIRDMPSYRSALRSEKKLLEMCCSLYGCRDEDILEARIDEGFKHMIFDNGIKISKIKRVNGRFSTGTEFCFYFKKSREGSMNEALGMALANILWGEIYRFAVNGSTLAVDAIPGKTFEKCTPKEKPEIDARDYGMAIELANALGMNDRHIGNVIKTGTPIRYPTSICYNLQPSLPPAVHIDFGEVFSSYIGPEELGLYTPKDTAAIKEGRIQAKEIICRNIRKYRPSIEKLISKARWRGASFRKQPIDVLDFYLTL